MLAVRVKTAPDLVCLHFETVPRELQQTGQGQKRLLAGAEWESRVEAARGNIETALQMVQGIDPAEMKSAYEEAKGDFYLQQGNTAAAYTAYESALAANDSTDQMIVNILQLKISQVKPVAVLEPATLEATLEATLKATKDDTNQIGESQEGDSQ